MWTAISGAPNDPVAHPTETVPTVVLLREALQFSTLDGAVAYLRSSPRGVPNNFILSQPGAGLVNIEMTTTRFTVRNSLQGLYIIFIRARNSSSTIPMDSTGMYADCTKTDSRPYKEQ